MIIDCHVHCFPDILAEKAVVQLSKNSGLQAYTNGTVADLIKKLDENKVNKAVVLNIAKKPNQDKKVNDFAIASNSDRLIHFGSVHPLSDSVEQELERLKQNGIIGIKLHPEYQEFDADDKVADKVYVKAQELGLIVAFHAGFDIAYPTSERAHPYKLRKVIDRFPHLKIQLAHFGGMLKWTYALEVLAGTDAYIDISMCGRYIGLEVAHAIIDKHGIDKMLFGTDSPWESWGTQYNLVDSLGLSAIDRQKLMKIGRAHV